MGKNPSLSMYTASGMAPLTPQRPGHFTKVDQRTILIDDPHSIFQTSSSEHPSPVEP